MSLLESIEAHPMAGALVAVILLLINSIIAKWKGKTNESSIQRESNTLVLQTSETVNKCAAENHDFRKMVKKYMDENDLGPISAQVSNAVQMLEKMDGRSSTLEMSLAGISRICDSIADDLRRGDHRVVHTGIINQIDESLHELEDVKRIVIDIARNQKIGK